MDVTKISSESSSIPLVIDSHSDHSEKSTSKCGTHKEYSQKSLPLSVCCSVKQAHSSVQTVSTSLNKYKRENKHSSQCANCGKMSKNKDDASARFPRLDPALETSHVSTCSISPDQKIYAKQKKLQAQRERKNPQKAKRKTRGSNKTSQKRNLVKNSSSTSQASGVTRNKEGASKCIEKPQDSPMTEFISSSASSDAENESQYGTSVTTELSNDDENGCQSVDDGAVGPKKAPIPLPRNLRKKESMTEEVSKLHKYPSTSQDVDSDESSSSDLDCLAEEIFQKCNLKEVTQNMNPNSLNMDNIFAHPQIRNSIGNESMEDTEVEDRYLRYQRMQIIGNLQTVKVVYSEIRNDKRMQHLEQLMVKHLTQLE